MSRRDKSDTLKKQTLESLEKSLGVVTTACKNVNLTRKTFYEWCNNDPVFKQAVDDIQDIALDMVESRLFKKINEEADTALMIFYLKTKGKKRGYIERSEVELSGITIKTLNIVEPKGK